MYSKIILRSLFTFCILGIFLFGGILSITGQEDYDPNPDGTVTRLDSSSGVRCGDAHNVWFTLGTRTWDAWGEISFCEGENSCVIPTNPIMPHPLSKGRPADWGCGYLDSNGACVPSLSCNAYIKADVPEEREERCEWYKENLSIWSGWCNIMCGNLHWPICGPAHGQTFSAGVKDWPEKELIDDELDDELEIDYLYTVHKIYRTDLAKILCRLGDPKQGNFDYNIHPPTTPGLLKTSYLDPDRIIRRNIPFPGAGGFVRWRCVLMLNLPEFDFSYPHPLVQDCWALGCPEYAPAPRPPRGITYTVRGEECRLRDGIRVPYPTFVHSSDGFLAYGSQNPRLGDGGIGFQKPALTYKYSLPKFPLISRWLPNGTAYKPSLNVVECDTYEIQAVPRSANRCEGHTEGPKISRNFKINYKPRVVRIEAVAPLDDPEALPNPNRNVSGHLGSQGPDKFGCSIDNPKTFKVTFKDDDLCADLNSDYQVTDPLCGKPKTPVLSLRAVPSTGRRNSFAETSTPIKVRCSSEGSNLVEAWFALEFTGQEVRKDLLIQAKAIDILGDSGGWSAGQGGKRNWVYWSYDGIAPVFDKLGLSIVSPDELNFQWLVKDRDQDLSGIRALRGLVSLGRGTLPGYSGYGPITYNGKSINVHEDLGKEMEAWKETYWTLDELEKFSIERTDLINIGKNQLGDLGVIIEGVDRACNYKKSESTSQKLGSAWVTTRGGLVHSSGDFLVSVTQSLYSNILPAPVIKSFEIKEDELTSLSSELITQGTLSDIGLGSSIYPYTLYTYSKSPNINRSWYEILLNRAKTRNPDKENWDEIKSSDKNVFSSTDFDKSKCIENKYVYFIAGSLDVDPEVFEDFSPVGSFNGCIFVVRDDIKILEGKHKSVAGGDSFTVGYDIVRGYFVADKVIDIPFVDKDKPVRDGLKVVGGLFATGGSDDKSILLGRSLQLRDNLMYPTLIIFHDARYLDIAREVFGESLGGGYIKDIGFKN